MTDEKKKGQLEILPPEGGDGTMERGAWGGKVEFILTCIGYAVGLGNVWRFPYLLFRSGGGAFLIPFILMLFLIGIPIVFMELNFGQFASLGPVAIWNVNPIMKGLGFSMIFTNMMVAIYYNVIISWCLYYLFASFTTQLPWEKCGNAWNTPYCTTMTEFRNLSDSGFNETIRNNITMLPKDLKTPSEEYYYRKVLQLSDGLDESGRIVWELALCLLLCWLIIFAVLIKGIASLGKVVYFTSTFPYLLLTIMLVRGVTLEGASKGIEFYMNPDWSRLGDLKVWSDAATQIFYALGTCAGGLIAMSSYNPFNNNTLRDSLIMPIVNVCTSIYAGFVIFSVLGYMATMKNVEVADVAADGPGLVFVVYPEGLSTMPGAPVWSVLFFMMMMMLGLSSMFSMVESFFCAFMDEYPQLLRKTYWRTVMFRACGIAFFYLISLPMVTNGGFYLFSIVDMYAGGFPLLVIGLIELLTITYSYGYHNFADDVQMMLGKKPNIVFRVCWSLVSPVVIFLVIIATGISYKAPTLFNGTYIFPDWAAAIGWMIVAFTLSFIPVVFVYTMFKNGAFKIMLESAKPLAKWGPAETSNRTGRYAVLEEESTEENNNEDRTGILLENGVPEKNGVPGKNGVPRENAVPGVLGVVNQTFDENIQKTVDGSYFVII